MEEESSPLSHVRSRHPSRLCRPTRPLRLLLGGSTAHADGVRPMRTRRIRPRLSRAPARPRLRATGRAPHGAPPGGAPPQRPAPPAGLRARRPGPPGIRPGSGTPRRGAQADAARLPAARPAAAVRPAPPGARHPGGHRPGLGTPWAGAPTGTGTRAPGGASGVPHPGAPGGHRPGLDTRHPGARRAAHHAGIPPLPPARPYRPASVPCGPARASVPGRRSRPGRYHAPDRPACGTASRPHALAAPRRAAHARGPADPAAPASIRPSDARGRANGLTPEAGTAMPASAAGPSHGGPGRRSPWPCPGAGRSQGTAARVRAAARSGGRASPDRRCPSTMTPRPCRAP